MGKLQLPGLSRGLCDNIEQSQLDAQLKTPPAQCKSPLSVATAENNSLFRNSDGSTSMERKSASPQHCTSSQQLGFLPLEVTSRYPK